MKRRSFIRALAAALPAGVAATQVASETDPIKAALVTLQTAISETAPEGFAVFDSLHISKSNIMALALPEGWQEGQIYALYNSAQGGWRLTA